MEYLMLGFWLWCILLLSAAAYVSIKPRKARFILGNLITPIKLARWAVNHPDEYLAGLVEQGYSLEQAASWLVYAKQWLIQGRSQRNHRHLT